ncbi:DUF2867 domain-containing protein [Neotabrizicola sp. sgz301269]|uniref:DUF2867 domain-containing protein n=1 Tax=Neotabrizicola sp. sgz301269 TaxID=3276282 RepID=UPI0037704891
MAQARADQLPHTSTLWAHHRAGDFLDCYSVESALTPQDAATRGLSMPAWARGLLCLRNALVRPLGLTTEAPAGVRAMGMFPVQIDSRDEFVLGFDDRHLNFRIAVLRQGARIYLSTWVHPHNLWGRTYLRLVLPFHILIVRGAIRRMAG